MSESPQQIVLVIQEVQLLGEASHHYNLTSEHWRVRKVGSGEDASRDGFLCQGRLGVPITDQKRPVRHNNSPPPSQIFAFPDSPIYFHL